MITNSKTMEDISQDLLDLDMFDEKNSKAFALALGEQLMRLEGSLNSSSSQKEKKVITNSAPNISANKKENTTVKDKKVNDLLDKPLPTSRDGKTENKGKRSITDRLGDIQDIEIGKKRGLDNQYSQSNKRERGSAGPMNMGTLDPNILKEQMEMMAKMSGFSSLEEMQKFNYEMMEKMKRGEIFGGRGRGRGDRGRGRGRFATDARGAGRFGRGGSSSTEEELTVAPEKPIRSAKIIKTNTDMTTTENENMEVDEVNNTSNDFEFAGDGTFNGRGGRGGRGRFSTRGRGRFSTRGGRGRGRGPPAASKNKVWVREPSLDTALPGTITSKSFNK